MSSDTLFRASAAAFLVGIALFAAGLVIELPASTYDSVSTFTTARWRAQELALLFAMPPLLLGTTGLYARSREAFGRPGFVGFVLASLGTCGFLAMGAITSAAIPAVARSSDAAALLANDGPFFGGVFPVVAGGGGAAFAIGWVLLSVVAVGARTEPRWGWAMTAAGAVLAAAPPMAGAWIHPVSGVLLGIGGAALGVRLWATARPPVSRSAG